VATIVGFAMVTMFRRRGLNRLDEGSKSFLEVLWSRSDERRGIEAAGRRGLMGEDDGAGLVRYANSSANLRVLLFTG
jgi:hypothetical protein